MALHGLIMAGLLTGIFLLASGAVVAFRRDE
jgi:hypothetical protein